MGSGCEYDYTSRLSFLAEWLDPDTGNVMKFYLIFFPFDNSVELWEKKGNKIFLRRSQCDGVSFDDMFLGNTVRIFSRQIDIKDYADDKTRKIVSRRTEKTFAIIKPSAMKSIAQILMTICQNGFRISRTKMCQMSNKDAIDFYEHKKSDSFLPFMIDHLCSGPILAMLLVGENAMEKWRKIMGPTDPIEARRDAPDTLRAIYGIEMASNGFHGSDSPQQADKEADFFFPNKTEKKTRRTPLTTAKFKNSTCCVIKPHAVLDCYVGNIICDIIDEGFKVTAIEMFYLSNPNADEFLEVYKGVVGDFKALMLSFIDGPCVALEVGFPEGDARDAHQEFRKFCGPSDPDVARQIRPKTLRSKYGVERYKNAVHCTDLPEDTNLELEYFFKLLET